MCQSGEQGLFFSIKESSCGVMVPFQMWEDDTTVTQLFYSHAVMVYCDWRDEPSYHDFSGCINGFTQLMFRAVMINSWTLTFIPIVFFSHLEKNVS